MFLIKERINEREPYISVEWLRVHKKKKSIRTLIFGRMVAQKRKIKLGTSVTLPKAVYIFKNLKKKS